MTVNKMLVADGPLSVDPLSMDLFGHLMSHHA